MKHLFTIVLFLVLALTGIRASIVTPDSYRLHSKVMIALSDSVTISARKIRKTSYSYDKTFLYDNKTRCRLVRNGKPISKAYNEIFLKGNAIVVRNYYHEDGRAWMKGEGLIDKYGRALTPLYDNYILGLCMERQTGIHTQLYTTNRYFVVNDYSGNGLVDSVGNEIIPLRYSDIVAVQDSVIEARNSDTVHYYNLSGQRTEYSSSAQMTAQPPKTVMDVKGAESEYIPIIQDLQNCRRFLTYDDFENYNYILEADYNGALRLLDQNGKQLTDTTYDRIYPFIMDHAYVRRYAAKGARVREDDARYGIINVRGQEVVPVKYDETQILKMMTDIIAPPKALPTSSAVYDTIVDMSKESIHKKICKGVSDLVCIFGLEDYHNYVRCKGRRGGRWQLLDTLLNPMSDKLYDTIDIFYRKRALVRHSGHWGLIDWMGREVLPPVYDSVVRVMEMNVCNFKFFVQRDGKWGVTDYFGVPLTEIIYDSIPSVTRSGCLLLQRGKCYYILTPDSEIEELYINRSDIFQLERDYDWINTVYYQISSCRWQR